MSERGRRVAAVVVLLLAAGLGGCVLFKRNLEPPTVQLQGLRAESLTAAGQVFRTRLRLDNPNAEDLRVMGGEVTLTLAGLAAGRAGIIDRFTLPANGTREVDLRVTLDLLTVLPGLLRQLTLGPGQLDYQLKGYVDLDVKALGRLPFKSAGKVSAEDLLRQAPGLLRRAPPRDDPAL